MLFKKYLTLYITIHKSKNIILKSILQTNINTLYNNELFYFRTFIKFIFVFTFHIARHFLDFPILLTILC